MITKTRRMLKTKIHYHDNVVLNTAVPPFNIQCETIYIPKRAIARHVVLRAAPYHHYVSPVQTKLDRNLYLGKTHFWCFSVLG